MYCIIFSCILDDDGDCDTAVFFLVRSGGSRCPVYSVGQVALDALFVFLFGPVALDVLFIFFVWSGGSCCPVFVSLVRWLLMPCFFLGLSGGS